MQVDAPVGVKPFQTEYFPAVQAHTINLQRATASKKLTGARIAGCKASDVAKSARNTCTAAALPFDIGERPHTTILTEGQTSACVVLALKSTAGFKQQRKQNADHTCTH